MLFVYLKVFEHSQMNRVFQRFPDFKEQWDQVQQNAHWPQIVFTLATIVVERLSGHLPHTIKFSQRDLEIYWVQIELCVIICAEAIVIYQYAINDENKVIISNSSLYRIDDRIVDRVNARLDRIIKPQIKL